jgi:hypothetical protein
MGDRNVDHIKNTEYAGYTNQVYSIYPQIINHLDANRVIDLTQENLMHSPDLQKFIYEYGLVSQATEVIQVGYSGSYLLSMALNRNVKLICNGSNFVWMAHHYLPKSNILTNYSQLKKI